MSNSNTIMIRGPKEVEDIPLLKIQESNKVTTLFRVLEPMRTKPMK
jgi:hypothetical protein